MAYMLLLALLISSCGTTKRAVHTSADSSKAIPPLTDPTEIAKSKDRAQQVLDSIERVKNTPKGKEDSVVTPDPDKPLRDQILDYAKTFIGTPYKLGAPGPDMFDCSNFTSYVFRHFGYKLTPKSYIQFRETRRVESFSDLKKGDLVFFGARNDIRDIGHVGIICEMDLERGSFTFIHASVSQGVTITSSNHPYFLMRLVGTGRILPD
ncbi:MAG: C40 family peptidase [Bacteroidales bacterium]|nr:C40 family peptidase [Bacteroidales bacterium]